MPIRQVLRAVGPLVFQEVSQVVVAEDTEQATATWDMPGHLKIDESRLCVGSNQHVGLLGEIVVHDVARVQSAQQPQGIPEIGRVPGPCMMHRCALEVLADQQAAVRADQPRYAAESVECGQHACLAAHEDLRQPAQWQTGRRRIAHDSDPSFDRFQPDFPKQVLFK